MLQITGRGGGGYSAAEEVHSTMGVWVLLPTEADVFSIACLRFVR